MKLNTRMSILVSAVTARILLAAVVSSAAPPNRSNTPSRGDAASAQADARDLPTPEEARGRARLLHETMHATVQIVHRQYYRLDEGLQIPARTLKDVFDALEKECNVKIRWLVVDADAMNVDHNPQDDFEKNAVKALASGKEEYERVENGQYRHAGAITLSSECLKCHLPRRTSTEDRTAGLVITLPLKKQ